MGRRYSKVKEMTKTVADDPRSNDLGELALAIIIEDLRSRVQKEKLS